MPARVSCAPYDLPTLLSRAASTRPDSTAIVIPNRTITFAELNDHADEVAYKLRSLGFGTGHRIALSGLSSAVTLIYLFGALREGLTVTILPAGLGLAALRNRLRQFVPDIVIDPENVSAPEDAGVIPRAPRRECALVVLWTTGSSGLPKAVVFEQSALLWNAYRNAEILSLHESDRALILLPIPYCYALVHQVISHFVVFASVAIPERPLHLAGIDGFIYNARTTTVAFVPSLLRALLRTRSLAEHLRHLRLLTVGGSRVSEEMLHETYRVAGGLDLRVTYGLTEAGPRVCTRKYRPSLPADGSVGSPLPGVEVTVSPHGELLVRSPSTCYGYLCDGEIVHFASHWLHTGDQGAIEHDNTIRIFGRIRPIIDRGGLKIEPAEIEFVLASHPLVVSAKVEAIPHLRLGQVPKAYVMPKAGTSLLPAVLFQYCLEQLGPERTPSVIDIVNGPTQELQNWKDE